MTLSKPIILLVALSLAVRLVFFVLVRPWDPVAVGNVILKFDAADYNQLASTLLHERQFSYQKDGPPDALRTPLYPIFIAMTYSIFGEAPWVVLLIQIVMDTCSCILLFLMLSRVLNSRVAWWASLFYAVDPFLILHSVSLLSDTLFVFLCVAGSYVLAKALPERFGAGTTRSILWSAVLLGLATLVRPVSQYLVVLIPLAMLIVLRKNLRRFFVAAAVFVSAFMCTIAPWLARNFVAFGEPSLSTSGAFNLLLLYAGPMEMERRNLTIDELGTELFREADDMMRRDGLDPKTLNPFQQARYWRKLGIQYIVNDPAAFVKYSFVGLMHAYTNLSTRAFADMLHLQRGATEFDMKLYPNVIDLVKEFLRQKSTAEIVLGGFIALSLVVSYVLLAVGLAMAWKTTQDKSFFIFCIAMVLYFTLIGGPYGIARYRMPAIPFYLGFVGIGAMFLVHRRKTSESPELSLPDSVAAPGEAEMGNASK